MSSKRRTTFLKNPKVNNEIASLDLITIDQEIKEATEKLDSLMVKRRTLYESIVESKEEKPNSYFY